MNGGLCIQLLSPLPGQVYTGRKEIPLRVQVNLSCGCPTGAGGRWDYRRFRLTAALATEGGEPVTISLSPGGEVGIFSASLTVEEEGEYLLVIEAYDPETGMAGRKRLRFRRARSA